MLLHVREATTEDAPAIARIHIAAWQAAYGDFMPADFLASMDYEAKLGQWKTALGSPTKGRYLVCEVGHRVAGFTIYGPPRDKDLASQNVGELVALNVHPAHWRCGVGNTLLEHTINASKARTWCALYLWVITGNQRAIRLYARHGFEDNHKTKTEAIHTTTHSYPTLHETRYVRTLT